MEEIDDLFLAEEIGLIMDRNYSVRERPDHKNICTDKEFFMPFRFSKVILWDICSINRLRHLTKK